jgi:dolichol-phosphate mannosyltransferase
LSKVCVVVPTYEEAENLPRLIGLLEESLQNEDFSLIVVDDASQDGTAEIAEKMNVQYRNIVVHCRPSKLGIGSAISDGIKLALSFPSCMRIVTMDADLSHDPKEVPHLLRESEGSDLVQGSRYTKGGKIIGYSPIRRMISYNANLLCRLLLRTGLHEHTNNFRVYSRKYAESLIEEVNCKGFEWFIVSILAAKSQDIKIKEVPITLVNRKKGRSKLNLKNMIVFAKTILRHILRKRAENFALATF